MVPDSPVSPPIATSRPESENIPTRGLVLITCVAGVVVFATAVASLYLPWAHYGNPSCLITVEGTDQMGDAVVTVTPVGGEIQKPLVAPLKNGENNRLRFHVPRGMYTVTVIAPGNVRLYPNKADPPKLYLEPGRAEYIQLKASGQPQGK